MTPSEEVHPCCRHERELRVQWQDAHLDTHRMEALALKTAHYEIDRRLEEMNKLRDQITGERGEFVRRELHDKLEREMDGRLKLLENARSNMEGRLWMIGGVISVILALVQLAIHYFK